MSGCCCQGLAVSGVPNDIPDPPPVCDVAFTFGNIYRQGLFFTFTEGAGIDDPSIANNTAWGRYQGASFVHSTGLAQRYYLSAVSSIGTLGAGYKVTTASAPFEVPYVGASYRQDHMWMLLPLTSSAVQYNMQTLYALQAVTLNIMTRYDTRMDNGPTVDDMTNISSYTTLDTRADVLWGLLDAADVAVISGRVRPKNAVIEDGGLAYAPNVLQTGVELDGAGLAIASYYDSFSKPPGGQVTSGSLLPSQNASVDLTSLLTQSGGDYLLLIIKPTTDLTQGSNPPTATANTKNGMIRGPSNDGEVTLSFTERDYYVPQAWPCISAMTVRIDIDQNSSTIIEEDRVKSAQYLSGTQLSKKFRITDNTPGTMGSLDEILDITTAANTLWLNYDPSGLDYTTLYPATPSATTTIGWDDDDDNEGQEYNLSSVTLAHSAGTITATVYVYADDTEADRQIDAEIYVGGAWTTPQNLNWSPSTSGWRTAVLATGLSVADFTGAKLRLTTESIPGGGDTADYSRVYVKLSSTGLPNINRQCDIFLTESGGTYYLNFDYYRATDPNQANYYIEPDPAFGNQSHANAIAVGPGETYENISDLEGAELVFTHSGSDNATPANGTVNATVRITIENISV